MTERPSFGWVKEIAGRPSFWIILALITVITIPHYGNQLNQPAFLANLLSSLGLDRHSFERIVYLVPIVWASLMFGMRGALAISLVALACMIPRAVLISSHTRDALFESSAVFAFGNVVALAIASLQKEKERRIQLDALHQTSNVVSQSLDLGHILNSSVANVAQVMRVDAAMLFLLDEETSELTITAYKGVDIEFAQSVGKLKLGEGFNGRVAETGTPLFIEDVSRDPSLTRMVLLKANIHSLLVVPLQSKTRIMGTLCVAMRSHRRFRQEEVNLLTAIGNQIGVAIENARLYEKERLATQRLAVSERNYRGLFENANDAIWVHDLEGNIIVANKAAERLVGYSLAEMTGMNVRGFLTAEGRALAGEIRHKLLENKPLEQPYEQRILRKDKTEAIVKLTTSLVVENGVPAGFHHIARDVTEEKRMQESLGFYLREVTRAQEEERRRIARELHDDTTQALVVLSRRLDDLASSANGLSEDSRRSLEDLWQQTNDMIESVRRLSQDLRPPSLDRLGLLPALEWLTSDMSQHSGIDVRTKVIGVEQRLPEEAELVLFRIAQEALRNVWKHSQATKAEVIVEFAERETRITISDNGKGFEVPKTTGDLAKAGRLGLAGMQERARLVGGTLAIQSTSGRGTIISVALPL